MHKPNRWLSRREYIMHAVLLMLTAAGILLACNVLFSKVTSARKDLTADGQFTLSPATSDILDRLSDRISVKVFLSPDLPAPDNTLASQLEDLLAEFEAASHDRLSFEIIEPQTNADEEIAKGFGLRKVAVSQHDKSQQSMRLVFKGLTVIYRDTAETLAELHSRDNLEYLLARTIVNLTAPEHKRTALLKGFGGLAESPLLADSMNEVFKEVFGNRVSAETASVNEKCAIDNPPDTLIILNIEKKLTPCAQYAIEQAMFRGMTLSIMQSPTIGDYRQPDQPRINVDAGINELLTGTGIQFNADLLLDREHNLVGTQYTGDSQIPVSLPALPIITSLSSESPITQNMTAIVLPFSGTLRADEAAIRAAGGSFVPLAKSSPESVTRPSGGDIQADALQKIRPDETSGPHLLAAALEIPLQSRFAGSLPEGADPSNFIASADRAKFFLVPDGDFLFANKIIGYPDEFARLGIHLFVNSTEWFLQDESLIKIRSRALPQMFRKPSPDIQKRIILFNTAAIPALVIFLALLLRLRRRFREKKIEKMFSSHSSTETLAETSPNASSISEDKKAADKKDAADHIQQNADSAS